MIIIGIHNGHDPSCALFQDGILRSFIENERIIRVKHGVDIYEYEEMRRCNKWLKPIESIQYTLDACNIKYADVDYVVLTNKDDDLCQFLRERFSVVETMHNLTHHQLHAYCALYWYKLEETNVVVVDYNGSVVSDSSTNSFNETTQMLEGESGFYVKNGVLTNIFTNSYKHFTFGTGGIAWFYTQACLRAGCWNRRSGWDEPGKLMALAAYGKPRFEAFQPACIDEFELEFSEATNWLNWHLDPDLRERAADDRRSEQFRARADFAAAVQTTFTATVIHLVEAIRTKKHAPVIMTGGGAMNIVTNSALKRKFHDANIMIDPVGYDAGLAIGAANFKNAEVTGKYTGGMRRGLFLGKRYGTPLIRSSVSHSKSKMLEIVGEEISSGKVIGWFDGEAEAGQRALGHRSVLASPAHITLRDTINMLIKEREPYRPLAPLVRVEDAKRWFDFDQSDHMMLACNVTPEFARLAPGAVHVDGTARCQTISRESNEALWRLLSILNEMGAAPIVLNTSLNVRGEPICETPCDAYRAFMLGGLDLICFNQEALLRRSYLPATPFERPHLSSENLASMLERKSPQVAIGELARRGGISSHELLIHIFELCASSHENVLEKHTLSTHIFGSDKNDTLDRLSRLLWRYDVLSWPFCFDLR